MNVSSVYHLCLILLSLLVVTPAQAELFSPCEKLEVTDSMSEVKKTAIEVLQQKTFHHCESITVWEPDDLDRFQGKTPEWLQNIMKFVASIFEGLLWALVGVIVIVLLLYLLRQREGWQKSAKRPQPTNPIIVSGMVIQPESLPEDLPASIRALWSQGQYREALGLLYRGSLCRLLERGLQIEEGFTEGDCCQAVRALNHPPLSQYFLSVTIVWQKIAYGHRLPSDADVMQLCDDWENHMSQQDQTHE